MISFLTGPLVVKESTYQEYVLLIDLPRICDVNRRWPEPARARNSAMIGELVRALWPRCTCLGCRSHPSSLLALPRKLRLCVSNSSSRVTSWSVVGAGSTGHMDYTSSFKS